MLELSIPGGERYDEVTETFISDDSIELRLEHSLVAVAEWESKWKTPFIGGSKKSHEMIIDYLRCMADGRVSVKDLSRIGPDEVKQIQEYLDDSYTATTFRGGDDGRSRPVTSEEIYGWMVAYRIPFECQYWNLNRLMMLIRVCGYQQNPKRKKEAQSETLSRYRSINEKRRAETEERLRAQRDRQR